MGIIGNHEEAVVQHRYSPVDASGCIARQVLGARAAIAPDLAAIACIEFQVDRWDDVEDGHGKLVWLLTPKQLRKDDGEIE